MPFCIILKMCKLMLGKIRDGNIHQGLNHSMRQNRTECQVNGVDDVSQTDV